MSAWVESVSDAVGALVEEQRPEPAAGEQHRRRRAGGASADDDDVVEVSGPEGARAVMGVSSLGVRWGSTVAHERTVRTPPSPPFPAVVGSRGKVGEGGAAEHGGP